MFLIAPSQSDVLARHAHTAYLRRTAEKVRADFPDEFADRTEEELLSEIKQAFDRLRGFGFSRKEHLHRLIVLELLYGPNFEIQLPVEARLFAFDGSISAAPEGERFWTIYKAADCLTRNAPTDPDDPFADLTFVREMPE